MFTSAAYAVMLLATAGLVFSAWSHVSALRGSTAPLHERAWLLHVGIFVVWLPTVIVAARLAKNLPKRDYWKAVLRGIPDWVRYAFYVLSAYAFINFFIFTQDEAQNRSSGGSGMSPQTLRGFSGHWMLFYGASVLVMLSYVRLQSRSLCPNGHVLTPGAFECETCHATLESA